MQEKKSFYITTTLPYVNADPHIGFAMELVHADVIARWKKIKGYDVFFNTGTDEHGQKVWQKAQSEGKDAQEYVDIYADKFKDLIKLLGLSEDVRFIRTTDEKHKRAAQEFWNKCEKAGDIYKKNYKTKYCVGCELEKTDSELEHGKCPIHPDRELEIREEENYFFRFSKYGDKLLELYDKGLVVPDSRANEVRELIKRGLEDFSISRLRDKMSWGIEVPSNPEHVMYVWFDALVNYISAIGWPDDKAEFNKWWPVVQFAGKDQTRQQAAMWQAMLMSAGLLPSEKIVIHGFLNISGQKMSKSLGNVINPSEMVEIFGVDAFRSMICGVNQFEDTDVSQDGFLLAYNSNLKDGIGNLVARIMKLAEDNLDSPASIDVVGYQEVSDALDKYSIQSAFNAIRVRIGELDAKIQSEKPWETKDKKAIENLVKELAKIAYSLAPFMPSTSEKVISTIQENKKPENLFPPINA